MLAPFITASFFCAADVVLKPEFEFVRSLKTGTTIEVIAIDQQTNLEFKCMYVVPKDSNISNIEELNHDNT